MTTSRSRGNATSTFLRLCSRAPRTTIRSWRTRPAYRMCVKSNRCSRRTAAPSRAPPVGFRPGARSLVVADLPGAVLLLERQALVQGHALAARAHLVEERVDLLVRERHAAALGLHDLLDDRAELLLVEAHLH